MARYHISDSEIHWPARLRKGAVGMNPEDFVPVDIPTTWKAMEALYDSGKVRAIGICIISTKKLGDLLDVARIPLVVVQVGRHPVWQQTKLQEFCKSKGVHLTVSANPSVVGDCSCKSSFMVK